MPSKRKAMRQIKEVLRLKFEARLSHERIAAACGVSKGAVTKYVKRAIEVGLGWPLPPETDDAALEALLFAHPAAPAGGYAAPPFAHIHQELKRKGVTLMLLWEEYVAAHPEGAYRYSQFCWHYGRFRDRLKRSMRQVHRAGDKLFIDYSGDTLPIIDAASGEMRSAELFIAVLGASNYTFAEATWTQQLPDWIGSHIRAFEFMGSVPALLVPDNLKSAIKQACRYEPEATSTYADMARHYATAILPARPFRPRDKAPVEAGVLLAQRWIVARLRNRQFFSLAELNAAISPLLVDLNHRPFKKLEGCRASAFASIDRPAMMPLPPQRYEFAEWKTATVNIDYHVERRRPLLQRAAPSGAPQARRALHRHHGGVLLQGQARGRPCPIQQPRAPHHHCRAHARVPPPPPAVDTGALAQLGAVHWPGLPAAWCAGSWRTARIPSRATAPAWGCSTSRATMARPGWRPPAVERWRLARPPASASNRSSRPSSTNTRSCSLPRLSPMPPRQR